MPVYRVPVSTYRVQFNQGFRFLDGRDLIPYLHDLGITDLYSSPGFLARRGSSHGYDVTNPMRVNSELGTEEDFDELAEKLRNYGMGLLLDIVPNHMAASAENPWWRDVLENGPDSEFAHYFDIDWHPVTSRAACLQSNRVLLPILGDLYGNVLLNQELTLKIEDTGFFVRYYDRKLPLNLKSSRRILEHSLWQLRQSLVPEHPAPAQLAAVLEAEPGAFKERLWDAYRSSSEIKAGVDETLRVFNGVKGEPRSFDALDEVLSEQAYRLAFWKIGYEEINYRRFFDINELVGLRVELPDVFEHRHRRILDLVRDEKVTGLRVDHVDGLYDPLGYLCRLQASVRAMAGALPDQRFYVVVEKILGKNETLRDEWPVDGTTGYDFLNAVSELFIDPRGLEALERIHARLTADKRPFAEICYACNKLVIQRLFTGEWNALSHELGKLAAQDRQARDIPHFELMQVLLEVTACLPIYRTYVRDFDILPGDQQVLEGTLRTARGRTPEERAGFETFSFLRRVFLLDPPHYAEDHKQEWLAFLMRWQQFTGPIMAKGVEDTAVYQDNSLISRNEVGADPLREGLGLDLRAFHRFNQRRLEQWPHALNATSTHDSKRSEDVRARINLLAEIPEQWEQCVDRWVQLNAGKKHPVNGHRAPSPGDELLIYQTLIGTWPLEAAAAPEFIERLKEFLVKAAREAKVHSSWIGPNETYESTLREFVDAILLPSDQSGFRESFLEFQRQIEFYGALNSLAQLLLKITAPGVPDFYQGSEIWNLSLVDPDNRRPVDYGSRQALLESLKRRDAEDRQGLLGDLTLHWKDGGIKLYVTYKALDFRRSHPELFREGEYLPLFASSEWEENVCAFARKRDEQWAVVAVPRYVTRLKYRTSSMVSAKWGTAALPLPPEAPGHWTNVLTGIPLSGNPELSLEEIFGDLPVALLEAGE